MPFVAEDRTFSIDATSELGYMSKIFAHWGSQSSETAPVRVPTNRIGGGGLSGAGSRIGNEKQRPVSRLSYHASGAASPPTLQRRMITYDNSKGIQQKTVPHCSHYYYSYYSNSTPTTPTATPILLI